MSIYLMDKIRVSRLTAFSTNKSRNIAVPRLADANIQVFSDITEFIFAKEA